MSVSAGVSFTLIYMTASSDEEAQKIARALLKKKLIACANIFPPHKALYKWEGEVQSEAEVAVIMKTQEKHIPAVEKAVKAMHSYDTPCLVWWPLSGGHTPFLEWIQQSIAD